MRLSSSWNALWNLIFFLAFVVATWTICISAWLLGTFTDRFDCEVLNHTQYGAATTTTFIHDFFLQYGNQLQANAENVEFNARVSLSATGKACFNFLVSTQSGVLCPHPYIRLRLSGAALVHVPLLNHVRSKHSDPSGRQLSGCALLPVPGTYYVDANLLHCRMAADGIPHNDSTRFKEQIGIPVMPNLNRTFVPHKFEMPPFLREATPLRNQPFPKNAFFAHHAWVFAPTCGEDTYTRSETCTKLHSPTFIPTLFQVQEWLANTHYDDFITVEQRFDNYMWLPVDPTNGIVNYAAEYFGHSYSPLPRFLQELGQPSQDADNDDGGADRTQHNNNKAILFLGDSHARYLHNQVSDIYYGRTQNYHGGGCGKYNPKGDDRSDRSGRYKKNLTRFRYRRICYGKDGGSGYGRKIFEKHGNHFDVIVVSIGQWDASRYDDSPSTPAAFLESVSILIAELEASAKPGVPIFVNTVIHSPMGRDMLAGRDWRVPPLIDMYNDKLWNQVEQVQFPSIKNAKSFRFKNRSRTYLLDGTDILDPIWDSSTDFSHPCRYFVRPMAMQVLELFKDDRD